MASVRDEIYNGGRRETGRKTGERQKRVWLGGGEGYKHRTTMTTARRGCGKQEKKTVVLTALCSGNGHSIGACGQRVEDVGLRECAGGKGQENVG